METWKLIETVSTLDFEYEVSNFGNVRSMNYNRTGKVQNLKIRYSPSRNRCVMLTGGKVYSVAKLVLAAFGKPKPSENHQPYHKDGDTENDHIDNLMWRKISVQNKRNGKKGFKFKKGHQYGLVSRFVKMESAG